jgi:hypothetical protein
MDTLKIDEGARSRVSQGIHTEISQIPNTMSATDRPNNPTILLTTFHEPSWHKHHQSQNQQQYPPDDDRNRGHDWLQQRTQST